MNFVGKFDAKLPSDGFTAQSHVHVEHPSAHAPADAIIVPDAHLLFGADFKRSGVDLILSNADRELVVHDYFKGEHRHPLASPDGAHLTGDIVNALTGQVDYAQADGSAGVAHVIGHVTKLTGSATAIRNGVSIILNQGDNVEKGDVVATGSDSTLGVTFIDGTVFGLSSNARMVLNEMVYDPNGSNNSSLISLVAGTISFVAGETAKHGDMKVDTPVATMGIRGTAVLVEIDFNVPGQNGLPDAKFQVLVEPDGTTGSYILFDKTTLDPIATVNKAGQQVNINQNGISYSTSPLTPELQKLISDVFTQKFSNTDTNTKTLEHFTDSIVPQPFQTFKGPDNIIVQAVLLQTNPLGNGPSPTQGPTVSHPHIDVAPTVVATSGLSAELLGVTGSHTPDVAGGVIKFADLNEGDKPTASTAFNSFVFQNAHQQDISHSLTPTELAAVQNVEVALNVVQDPAGINIGTATWTYSVPDGALDFLGAGETLTLTYLATVNNNFAQSIKTTTVPITITITGTNDVPVITSAVPQTIAFDGGISVAGGDLTPHVPTSGTIAFDDPDLTDTHTVSVAAPVSTLTDPTTHITTPFTLPPTPLAIFNQALTASITDPTTGLPTDSTGTGFGTVSWSLAELPVWLGDFVPKGETLNLTYVVTVTDSQGATAQQDITVTITGTDTPAVVWIATTGTGPAPDGLWSTAANWETGNVPTSTDDAIIITDQLEGLTPTYPVTITSAAAAQSLTMDNFGGSAPVLINQSTLAIGGAFDINDHSTGNPAGYTGPELDNQDTLTVGGAFSLNADSIVKNSGSITVTGKMEALDQSTVQNSGTIKLAGGGDFSDQSAISNTTTGASIEVSGGTLNVGVDISNLGTVKIDPSAALKLASATIDGGTVTNSGTLTLNGAAVVKDGTLGNSDQINASGTGNALDNEQVTNTGGIEVVALGALTLDLLTTVANTGHTITVDGTGTLTLQGGSSITSGNLSNSGAVDIEGTGATLDGVTVSGSGAINVDSPVPVTLTTLVLKDTTSVTTGTLTVGPTGILSVAGSATLDHVGVTNQNSIEVTAGHALTLDDSASVDNTSGTVTVDGTATLALNDASINGGTVNDFSTGATGSVIPGDIDITGASTISNAHLNNGNVTVGGNVTLTLTNDTVAGASFTDTADGATIQIVGDTTLDDVIINGGTVTNTFNNVGTTITIDGGQTLTLQDGVTVSGGSLSNSGTLDIESSTGATLNGVTITGGGAIEVDPAVQVTATPLVLEGGTSITGGTLTVGATSGALEVKTAAGATLDHVGVTNDKSIEVFAGSNLSLVDGTTVGNGPGTITVDGSGTLKLNDAEITGGTINITSPSGTGGTIDVTGASKIDGNATLNHGDVTVESTTLTLDNVTVNGSTITEETTGSIVQVDGTDKLTLEGGATIQGASGVTGVISNAGTIEVAGAASLLDDKLTNTASGSIVQVDDGQTLTLSGTEIAGGTINITSPSGTGGTIDITGASKIDGSATLNHGSVTVESTTLTLDNVTVNGSTITEETSGSIIQIDGTEKLTLEGSAIIQGGSGVTGALSNAGTIEISGPASLLDEKLTNTASGSIVQVDDGQTLTLSGTEIAGGTINDTSPSGTGGTIDVTGSSKIDGNATLNHGDVTVESTTLTLDNVTVNGTRITEETSGSIIQIDGTEKLTLEGSAIIQGGSGVTGVINNAGTIEVAGATSLLDDKLTNTASGSIVQVDDGQTLTLSGTEIAGGAINDFSSTAGGTIDVTGASKIDGSATLNHGNVTVESTTLTLDNVTVNGTRITEETSGSIIQIDGTDRLTLEGSATIQGGSGVTGVINNAGTIEVAGAASLLDEKLTNTASGSIVQVDDGDTLTLNGATITGGTINNFSSSAGGTIDVTGSSTISNAHLNNGNVTLGGNVMLTLSGDTVAGTSFNDTASGATIQIVGNTVLDDVTVSGGAVTNTFNSVGTTITIDDGQTLTLQDGVTVSGGSLSNSGTLDIESSTGAALNGVTVTGGGAMQIDGVTPVTTTPLVLEGGTSITGGTLTVGATSGALEVKTAAGATLDHVGVTNDKSIEVFAGSNLSLVDGTTVGNGTGTITVDGSGTLKLNDAEITGGTVNDSSSGGAGTIDVIGASKIDGSATLNSGNVTVESATLTLDNVTVNGSTITEETTGSIVQIDGPDRLTLEGSATIQGGSGVTGALSNAGTIEISGAASLLDEKLTNTASGSIVQVDDGQTLTLSGTEIAGGAINDFSSTAGGTIDVTGASKIDGSATLNHGSVTVESTTLTLDNVTVNGTRITEETTGSLIQVDGTDKLTLEGGATIQGGSGVTGVINNAGTIEAAGATSLLDDKLTNTASGSLVQVDDGQTLTLSGTEIAGGTINITSPSGTGGTIDVTGASKIDGSATLNHGSVKVESTTLTLDNVTVNGTTITEETTGSIVQIDGTDRLTLEGGTTIQGGSGVTGAISNAGTIEVAGAASLLDEKLTNTVSGSIVQVDDGQTLTLSGTEIVGGTINITSPSGTGGTIDVTGSSKIDGSATLNSGNVTVESATLTLDNVTVNGTTITEETTGSLIQVDGNDRLTLKGSATIQGGSGVTGAISNAGTIEVAGAASLLDDKLTNTASGSIVQVDDGQTLTLSGTEIAGGTINITSPSGTGGTIDITGASKIDGSATLNHGSVTVESTTLTLDNVTVNGSTITEETSGSIIQIDGTEKLTLEGSAIIQGGSGVTGALSNAGTIEISGPASLLDEKLTNTASGSIVQVDDGQTLTLSGTEIAGGTINDTSPSGTGGTIDVTGSSKIDGNATLNHGDVTVESTTLTLDNVTVNGTRITEETSGSIIQIDGTEKLTLEGSAIIQGGSGVTGVINNAGTIEVAGATSLLDDKLTNTASGSIVQVDDGQTLTLSGTEIAGGAINDFSSTAGGTIDVTGASKIDGSATLNHGNVTVESTTLTLDNVTVNGTRITEETSGSIIQIDGTDRLTLEGSATIQGGSGVTGVINNAGTIEVAGAASLLDEKLTNTASGSIVQVDDGDTLTLNGATITGGTINNFSSSAGGTIDVTGSSTISNAHLNNGNVTLGGNVMLTLSGDTVAGTSFNDTASGATIQIVGNTVLDDVTVSGGAVTNTFNSVGTTITIDDGQTLTLQDGVTVSGGSLSNSGTLDIESSTGAALNGVTVTGGGAMQIDGVTPVTTTPLVLEGGTSITGGTLTVGATSGALEVKTAAGATLDHVGVTNDKSIEVFAGSNLSLVDGTTVGNGTGTITVDGSGTLKLNDAEITGGTVNDSSSGGAGTIDVIGASKIDGSATLNSGNVTVESATLTLDNVTVNGSTITEETTGSIVQIDGPDRLTLEGSATIQGGSGVTGALSNAGTIEVAGAASLLDEKLTNTASGSIVQVDDGQTLTLSGTEIAGGTINITSPSGTGGTIDVTGSSKIDGNATLNHGSVTVESTTLTLDNVTVNGSTITEETTGSLIQVDGTDRLTLEGSATIQGGSGVTGAISNAGTIEVAGAASLLDEKLTNTASGSIVQVDDGQTLTLSGTEIAGGTINDTSPSGTGGTIDVTGTSKIDGSATLNHGSVTVESTTLTLDNVTVDGSTITEETTGSLIQIDGNDRLTLKGSATIQGGSGVTGAISNAGTIEVAGAASLLDEKLTNTASGSIVQVDDGQTLTLSGTEIAGGTINITSPSGTGGTIDVTGASKIDGSATLNHGSVKVESTTLTLDNVTVNGTRITEETTGSIVQIDGTDRLTLEGGTTIQGGSGVTGAISNAGTIEVAGAASLLDEKLTNTVSGSIVQVDDGQTLTLSGTEIVGGTINITSPSGTGGTIDVTGSSKIDGSATLNSGNVTVESATLTLDNVTVNGTTITEETSGSIVQIDGNDTLTLNGANFDGGIINAFSPGAATGSVIAADIDVTGSSGISNAHLNNGHVTIDSDVHLGFDNSTVTGTSFDDNASGATIDIAGTVTMNDVSIDGGTVHNFSTINPGGQIVANTIDVNGDSTISDAQLNGGNVTLGANAMLTLDGSTVTGTSFDDTASGAVIQIDGAAGDTVTFSGVDITGGGITIAAHGLVQTNGNVTLTDTGVTNDGTIEVTAGILKITGTGSVADSVANDGGTIQIDGGATLDLNASDTQNISFSSADPGGILQIDTTSFSGNIVGLAATDQIDLSTIGYGPGTTATYVSNADDTGGTLKVTDGQHSITLQLVGDYSNAHFAGSADGNGTLITLNANDDAPAFTSGETAQTATVSELADVTASPTMDDSSPAGGAIHFTDIDLTDRPTATVTQTVTWTGSAALTGTEVDALEGAFQLAQPVTNTNNGEIDWTYAITDGSLDFLGAGETATVTSTITLSDHQGGQDMATVTVTIDGANDLPTISATGGAITELPNVTGIGTTDTATGAVTFSDADVDDRPTVIASFTSFDYKDAAGDELTLTTAQQAALETALTLSPSGGNTNNGTVGWSYSVTDSALDFMAAGDKLTLTYTATVNDHNGGTASTPITVTINGSDDLPMIHGNASGAVTDGGVTDTSGVLTATDPDRGDSVTWSVVGGTSVAPENYDYGLEDLKVVKGGNTIFHDTFTGTAPPTGPNFAGDTNGTNAVYAVSGGTFVAGSTATQIEGVDAAPVGISLSPSTYGDVVFGQYTTLLTGTSFNAAPGVGLRSGEAFTASAVFDLDNPADSTTHYGLRLSDRVNGSAGGTNDQPGTETVDLHVEHNADGSMSVQLNEIDFETGTVTNLQTIQIETGLTQGITDNAVLLDLSNATATNGHITASFQLFGTNSSGTEVADGGPVAFSATGQIFDTEDWTRVQVYGQSVGTSDTSSDVTADAVSVLQGTYGTLDVNEQTGTWQYFLNPGLASVKALAAGQTAVDTFTIAATDTAGQQTTQAVNVTVTGIDDAPTVSFAPAYLQFNGHSAAVGPVATTNIGNGTDGVALDGWVNWNGIGDPSHGQVLFYNGNTSTAGFGMFGVPTAGGSLDLEILAGGATIIDTGIKLTAGQWYNVALSHVNDIFTLDVDGAVVYTSGPQGAFAMGHLNTPDFTLIGGNSGDTEGFNGGIADVSIWNSALTLSQVQAIEFTMLTGNEPGLAAYYPLDGVAGTTAMDLLGSAGNLTLSGNPLSQTANSWPMAAVVSTAENHAVTINGITVNDVDAGSSQIEVTLAAGHGALSLANAAGLDNVITNNDGSINLFGSQAAIDTALSHGVIYTPVTDYSGADTLTVTANDQVSAALGGPLTGAGQVSINVEPGSPTFSSMTLSIAQGGTDVLTDANFNVTDPDTSQFLYSVNNVSGGQFEVFNGTNWVSAPTGGFTTAQIEAGHVEFVQDGTDAAPNFSITAADGTNVSAAISPTVNFTPTPPVAHDDVFSGPSGSGWVLDTDNGHYYREVATLGSFETAVAGAAADGGYLATITSAAEQSFIVNHVIDGFSATWLGGETNNDRPDGSTVNESVWSWVTGPEAGTQFSYTNWNPGEPSGGFGATTQWLQIGSTGGWNDAPDAGQPGDSAGAGYLEEWGGTSTQVAFLENTGTSIATSVLLANDTDVNGLPLTVTAVGDSNGHSVHGGTVSLNGNVITYMPSTSYSGPDSFTYTITDGSGTSTATVSFDVAADVAPVLNSMTLTVAQGGTEVLTDANFNVTDPDSASFLYSVNNVTGGQFEVFNGNNWVSAPTGGFTTAQIEAGHVEFVQDGTAAVPNFSISVSDGINASAAIAPTVLTLAGTSSFGGPGEHQSAAVTFADGHLYLSYNNGPANYDTSDTAEIVALDTGSGNPTQTFTYDWGKGDFFGIAADGSQIYAVGESNPHYGLTTDVGDVETKSILVQFDTGGTAGSGPSSPALSDTPNNFFSYEGFEYFNKDIVVEQAGQEHVYAVGTGQPNSYDAYFIAEYDTSGNLLAAATDSSVGVTFANPFSAPIPGSSGGNGVVAFDTGIWALGYTAWPTDNGGATNQQAVVWEYDASLDLIGRFKDTDAALSGQNASFNDGAVVGNSLYAVGYASNSSGGQNYLIADYHADGSIAWSESFGPAGTDVLTGAVGVDGLLFVVGSTTSGGITEGVLMEIDLSNGSVLSTITYDPAQYDSFTSIATDGQQLYIAGVSGSSASQDQAVLLTYSVTSNNFAPDHVNNLIVNGGFETGDFSGWNVGGDNTAGNHAAVGSGAVQNIGDTHHGGLAEALLGGSGGDLTLSQTVATTAGEHYTVDFWLMDDASGNGNNSIGNDFSATWNGVALTTLTTDPGSTYTEYQFDVTGAANATQSTLEFFAQTGTGSWALDDVSVRDGAPTTVQQVTDQTTSVAGVNSGDPLTIAPVGANSLGTVTAIAGAGTTEWQFAASNAQLDHLIGMTQSFTVTDQNNSAVSQTVAVSVGGAGNDQLVFAPGVGADTMVNFTTASNAQGAYVGETIELNHFSGITSVSDVLTHLSTDSHGNAVVDLGNHDSITFQGTSAAAIQANAAHIFQVLA